MNGVELGKDIDVNVAESFFVAAQDPSSAASGGGGSGAIALLLALVTALVLLRLLRGAWAVLAPVLRPVLALAGALVTVIIVIIVLLGGIPKDSSSEAPVTPGQTVTSVHAGGERQL